MSIHSSHIKYNLFRQLEGVYGSLHRKAYEITSHDPNLFIPTIDSINRSLKRWADHELKRAGENTDLTGPKQNVCCAFEELIDKHSLRGPATGGRCRACKGPLETKWFDVQLTCETCVVPVHAAIDQLVRDSTKIFTPERLMDECQSIIMRAVACLKDREMNQGANQ